jgi:hypothetical protein
LRIIDYIGTAVRGIESGSALNRVPQARFTAKKGAGIKIPAPSFPIAIQVGDYRIVPEPEALPDPERLPEALPVSDPDTLPEALPEPEPEPLPEALPEALHPANANAPTSSGTASNVVFMVFTPFSFIVQPDGQRSIPVLTR